VLWASAPVTRRASEKRSNGSRVRIGLNIIGKTPVELETSIGAAKHGAFR
jgi:hypothetical protein